MNKSVPRCTIFSLRCASTSWTKVTQWTGILSTSAYAFLPDYVYWGMTIRLIVLWDAPSRTPLAAKTPTVYLRATSDLTQASGQRANCAAQADSNIA
jgi:hypothetical protein